MALKLKIPGNSGLRWVHLFTFFAGLAVVAMWLGKAGLKGDFWLYFNADTLYLPSVCLDLFKHGSGLRGWHLNASPNFFPDMVIYGGLMAILKGPALTYFVFTLVQFTTVMVLISLVVRTWDPAAGRETHIFMGLVMVMLVASPMLGENPVIPYQLIAPSFHCGVFINTLLVLWIGMRYIRSGHRVILALTGCLALLAVLSDRLFLVGGLFPLLVLLVISGARKRREYRSWILLAVVTGASLAGMMIFHWLNRGESLHFIDTGWKMFNFANAGASFRNLSDHLWTIIAREPLQRWIIISALLFYLAAPLYLLRSIGSLLKNRMEKEQESPYQLVLILFVFSMAVLFTPVINGSYLGPALVRFNFPALIVGSVGSVYLLFLLTRGSRRFLSAMRLAAFASIPIMLVLLAGTGIRNNIPEGIGKFTGYYPERAEAIDALKEKHDLKCGLAGYWAAKPSMLFSKQGMRIYPIHEENLKPYYHVTNENWFHEGGKGRYANPVFNFIVADTTKISSGQLQELFGDRLDTLYTLYDEHIIRLPDFRIDRTTRGIILAR